MKLVSQAIKFISCICSLILKQYLTSNTSCLLLVSNIRCVFSACREQNISVLRILSQQCSSLPDWQRLTCITLMFSREEQQMEDSFSCGFEGWIWTSGDIFCPTAQPTFPVWSWCGRNRIFLHCKLRCQYVSRKVLFSIRHTASETSSLPQLFEFGRASDNFFLTFRNNHSLYAATGQVSAGFEKGQHFSFSLKLF